VKEKKIDNTRALIFFSVMRFPQDHPNGDKTPVPITVIKTCWKEKGKDPHKLSSGSLNVLQRLLSCIIFGTCIPSISSFSVKKNLSEYVWQY
jgi:hypothetical protein